MNWETVVVNVAYTIGVWAAVEIVRTIGKSLIRRAVLKLPGSRIKQWAHC